MNELVTLFAILIFQILLPVIVVVFLLSEFASMISGSPYVPISKKYVKKILSFGGLSYGDVLYDLGCGDGRVLISGRLDFGVSKAIGFERALWPYLKTLFLIKSKRLSKIEIFRRNLFKADIGQTTFIYLYLFPKLTDKVAYKIASEGRSKTKILCISFPIDTNLHPEFQLLKSTKIDSLTAYLYELKNPRQFILK